MVFNFWYFLGSVIIFVGILSVAFLERVLKKKEWVGIIFVILGLVVVGLSDFLFLDETKKDSNSVITGDLLIVIAQIITAVQMVVEEKYVAGLDIPSLQAVGWEGKSLLFVLKVNYLLERSLSKSWKGDMGPILMSFTMM